MGAFEEDAARRVRAIRADRDGAVLTLTFATDIDAAAFEKGLGVMLGVLGLYLEVEGMTPDD